MVYISGPTPIRPTAHPTNCACVVIQLLKMDFGRSARPPSSCPIRGARPPSPTIASALRPEILLT